MRSSRAKTLGRDDVKGRRLNLALDQLQLELGNRLGGIEALRAGLGAVHDGVAAIQPERIFEIVEPLAGRLIAAVLDPACRLQQCRGPQETLAVPPIARARGRAAGAKNAFVEAVELFAVLMALPPFLLRRRPAPAAGDFRVFRKREFNHLSLPLRFNSSLPGIVVCPADYISLSASRQSIFFRERWMCGSSPRMTRCAQYTLAFGGMYCTSLVIV